MQIGVLKVRVREFWKLLDRFIVNDLILTNEYWSVKIRFGTSPSIVTFMAHAKIQAVIRVARSF